jgi:tRNA threonylcarbamoyladenosine biosynthesis protein TsaE
MMEKIRIITSSTEETIDFGRRLGHAIDRPVFIALTGDLGSGKTALVRGIARGLGIPPDHPVTSPSYTLINEYNGRFRLFHIDLYRLTSPDETYDLGLDDIMAGDGVVAVEWAERLGTDTFSPDIDIHIQAAGDNDRIFTILFYGPEITNLVEGIKKHFTTLPLQ